MSWDKRLKNKFSRALFKDVLEVRHGFIGRSPTSMQHSVEWTDRGQEQLTEETGSPRRAE